MTKETPDYIVDYDTENHWKVLTQMRGSTWPRLWPYCVFNVLLMMFITFLDKKFEGKYSIEISNLGHSFIALVVAFLLVSRVNIAMGRYNQARNCLGAMYKETRDLVQHACIFSSLSKTPQAEAWRYQLAHRALLMLRTSMAVIDHPVKHVAAFDIPELQGTDEKRDIDSIIHARRWAHAERTEAEEAMRVPLRMAYLCRKTIHSHSKHLDKELQISQENKLLGHVDAFLRGYYGIRRFLTTPVPFPLIQMARTFLFLYVFTVPFVLAGDDSSLFAHCFTLFVLTYGFVGLELVAIEMDNPFGDDPNDFDNAALALLANEDCYLAILDADGPDATDKLRASMHDKSLTSVPPNQAWLLSRTVV